VLSAFLPFLVPLSAAATCPTQASKRAAETPAAMSMPAFFTTVSNVKIDPGWPCQAFALAQGSEAYGKTR
jgi:hypothetical protein